MNEILYYLILGWRKDTGEIVEPILKTGKSYLIICPKDKDIDYLPCYCSDSKEVIEDMYKQVWPLFKLGKIAKDYPTIPRMVELCKLTERNIKFKWQKEKMEKEESF